MYHFGNTDYGYTFSADGAPGESGNPPPGGKRPHIVVILADDLGWKDVSWHNRQMITPRMEVA